MGLPLLDWDPVVLRRVEAAAVAFSLSTLFVVCMGLVYSTLSSEISFYFDNVVHDDRA